MDRPLLGCPCGPMVLGPGSYCVGWRCLRIADERLTRSGGVIGTPAAYTHITMRSRIRMTSAWVISVVRELSRFMSTHRGSMTEKAY